MASVTTIDEDGDLLLLVGSELSTDGVCPETFKVDSRTLCRASKVFKVMLRGPFSEGKKRDCDGEWLVKLPEDRPKPMARILEIIHGNFDNELPNLISDVRALYELTILTDKYSLIHLLKPWAIQWACRGRNGTLPFSSWDACITFDKTVLGQCLWIAWELGDIAWFTQLLQTMAMRNDIDACGELIATFESAQEPQDAYGIIKELRLRYLKSMLGRFEDAVECLASSEPGTDPYYSCRKHFKDGVHSGSARRETESCRASLLGSLIMGLRKKDLWPIPDGLAYCSNPAVLKEHMIELRTKRPKHTRTAGLILHEEKQPWVWTTGDEKTSRTDWLPSRSN
ncbi:putative BTB domain-containing protein [Seiridium cardinale]